MFAVFEQCCGQELLECNEVKVTQSNGNLIQLLRYTNSRSIKTSYPDLKPKYLEKEANLIEMNTWIRQVGRYIREGYKHIPPKKGVYMHLSPLLHQIWISALDCKNPEDKSLEELTELIKDEAQLRQHKHQCHMALIQTKRGSGRHGDFLDKISEKSNWKKLGPRHFLILAKIAIVKQKTGKEQTLGTKILL